MKHNSKQFLALFMAVSMAVAPVSGVYAEDQNAAVGDTLSENKQDSDEVGQTELEAAAGQTQSTAGMHGVKRQQDPHQVLRRGC